jgi:hypothetical protein
LAKTSKLSTNGAKGDIVTIPGVNAMKAGQTFHVIEVFFNYRPYIVTFIGQTIATDFYERTIFTNVSGLIL